MKSMLHKAVLTFALSIITGSSIFGGGTLVYFEGSECHIPQKYGNIQLGHDGSDFFIESDNGRTNVQRAFTDKLLRSLEQDDLLCILGRTNKNKTVRFLTNQDMQVVAQMDHQPTILEQEHLEQIVNLMQYRATAPYLELVLDNSGEPVLHMQGRLNGGGALGGMCGAWLGKFAVHLGAQAIITCISVPVGIFGTPAAGVAVHTALTKTTAPMIEATSIAVAMAGGIGGAVITGPA